MLTRMAPLLTRMARMARLLTRMTRWLAYYTHSIGVVNRMPVKMFHVQWIFSSNLTLLPACTITDFWVFSF